MSNQVVKQAPFPKPSGMDRFLNFICADVAREMLSDHQ